MRPRAARFIASLALALAGACAPAPVHRAAYVVAPPQLAYIGPDLYVVPDSAGPIFYSAGFYWRAHDRVWYRSPYFDRGWIAAHAVPVSITRIGWPARYAHFHGGPGPRR